MKARVAGGLTRTRVLKAQHSMTTEYVPVIIYCTFCGNRTSRNLLTGVLHESIIRIPRSMIAEIQKGVCIYCRGTMDARVVVGGAQALDEP